MTNSIVTPLGMHQLDDIILYKVRILMQQAKG